MSNFIRFIMMRKYAYLSLIVLVALAGCKKSRVETPNTQTPDPTPEVAETPVPIMFQTLMPQVQTKSTGALDHWLAPGTDTLDIRVFGIAREGEKAVASANLDFETKYSDAQSIDSGILIDNRPITFLTGFDYSAAAATDPQGNVAIYRPEAPYGSAEPATYYYSDKDRRYEFFGYFVDDAANPDTDVDYWQKYPDIISIPVVINGSQDLMVAKADKDADNTEASVNPNRMYSAYSARQGVTPNLQFQHLLSRFNVKVRIGDPTTDDISKKITVTTLSVETNTTGDIEIVHKAQATNQPRLTNMGDKTFLGIWKNDNYDASAAPNLQLDHALKAAGGDYYEATSTGNTPDIVSGVANPVGNILVMPGDAVYRIKLGMNLVGSAIDETITETSINFANLVTNDANPDAVAMAGREYDVELVIYGLRQVDITVSMTDWVPGGEFHIDEDRAIRIEAPVIGGKDGKTKATAWELTVGTPLDFAATLWSDNFTPDDTTDDVEITGSHAILFDSRDESIATVAIKDQEPALNNEFTITPLAAGYTQVELVCNEAPNFPAGGYRMVWIHVTEP